MDFIKSNSEPVTPDVCTCQDGSTEIAPLNVKTLKNCKPSSCHCPATDDSEDRNVEIDFAKMKDKLKFFKRRFEKLGKLCPSDSPPTSCTCSSDSSMILEDFENPLAVLDCLPNTCQCTDGTTRNLKLEKPFNRLAKICGKVTYKIARTGLRRRVCSSDG